MHLHPPETVLEGKIFLGLGITMASLPIILRIAGKANEFNFGLRNSFCCDPLFFIGILMATWGWYVKNYPKNSVNPDLKIDIDK